MIDPLALIPRTLEACRPAAERAEERVAVAAAECPAHAMFASAGSTTCHSARACGARSAEEATHNQRRKPQSPVIRAGQRPSGQAALAVPSGAARGWRV
jgi:hypothetical protein